ncbi:MAG: ABC transporter substrate-binding protein [Streptosporangiaceae bacterium]|nr:ABC transporter substrate-binding protein [Streptosporangiaceae bacterium]
MRRLTTIGVFIAAGLLAAGCSAGAGSGSGGSGGSSGNKTTSSVLVLDNENGSPWTCDFNPFLGADNPFLDFGYEYEPLIYVNPLQNGATTPMLATSYSWSADHKDLTFQIRQGVKWSDGQPFTAADVVYTFDLVKGNTALDNFGLHSVISSVTQDSANSVTVHLNSTNQPYFYYIADETPMVPKHIWSTVAKPDAYPDNHPVGTGPYLMNKCTPQNVEYKANPHYWQPGLPKVQTLEYPAYLDNNTANNDLASGKDQWGSQYIPGIQQFYLAKSPSYHYWFPPTVNLTMIPNLSDPQLKDPKVRLAMSYALNRQQISTIGESGYELPGNQTGIVTPTFSADESSQALAALGNGYDPAKAKSLLAQAGYHMGSDGIMVNAAGQKLSFGIINNAGFSDWVAAVQVAQQQLKAVGIQITPHNQDGNTFTANLYKGDFQLAFYDQQIFGPSPWYELNNWLNSANATPIGTEGGTNYERYKDTSTDALLNQFLTASTTDQQKSILAQLQMVMVTQAPIIPVLEAVDWFQYDSGKFSGWPTASNPYAQPAIYAYPDLEQVLLHLTPAG